MNAELIFASNFRTITFENQPTNHRTIQCGCNDDHIDPLYIGWFGFSLLSLTNIRSIKA